MWFKLLNVITHTVQLEILVQVRKDVLLGTIAPKNDDVLFSTDCLIHLLTHSQVQ